MDYRRDKTWYDGSGASRSKKSRMDQGLPGEFTTGITRDMDSLMSRPGFTLFAKQKSLLDSAPGFDYNSSSGMHTGLDYGFSSNARMMSSYDGLTSNPGIMSRDIGFRSNPGLMSTDIDFSSNQGLMSSDVGFGSSRLMSNDIGFNTNDGLMMDDVGYGSNFGPMSHNVGLGSNSGLMSSSIMGNSGYDMSGPMSGSQGKISQMGRSVVHGGSRKRTMPSQNQSELKLVAAEVQKRTNKKVDVNKILKVMEIVDKMDELDGQPGRAGSGQSSSRLSRRDQQSNRTRYTGLDMMGNPEVGMMPQDVGYGNVRPDFTLPPDPGLSMDPMMSRRLPPKQSSSTLGLSRNSTNPNVVGRSQRSLDRRDVDFGGRPDAMNRRPRSTGRDAGLGMKEGRNRDMYRDMGNGRMEDRGARSMDMSHRHTDMRERQLDIGRRQMDRGRQMDMGGRQMDMGGRQMDRGRPMDRGNQMDMRGRPMEKGNQMDMRGRPMERGNQIDMRGRPMDRGNQMDMSGRQMDMGGRSIDTRPVASRAQPNDARNMAWGSGAQYPRDDREGRPHRQWNQQESQSRTSSAIHTSPRSAPPRKLTLVEKVKAFITFLKSEKLTKNKINLLDCAFDRCKLGLKKKFTIENFARLGTRLMHSALLTMDGVFLARSYGSTKKDIKAECYRLAVEALLNESAEALIKKKDPGTEKVAKEMIAKYEKEQAEAKEEEKEEENEEEMDEDPVDENVLLSACQKGLMVLTKYLKPLITTRQTVVDVLDSALKDSKCKLNLSYSEEEVQYKKMPWFIGTLELQHVVIAAGSGINKSSAKKSTYEKAVEALKKKTWGKIQQGIKVNKASLMPVVTVATEQTNKPSSASQRNIQQFLNTMAKNKEPDFVWLKDRAKASGLTVLILTHRGSFHGKSHISCDLFLDNIYIASGEGPNKANAEERLFKELLKVFSATTADVIFNDFNRLSEDDTNDLIEASEMSNLMQSKTEYNDNFGRIKSYITLLQGSVETDEVESVYAEKDRDDFVIFEEPSWATKRYIKAYDILQLSAKMNLMALHFEFLVRRVNTRCRLFLQFDLVAESTAPMKNLAKQRACAEFLFKLYQSQPAIRILDTDVEKTAMSIETVEAKGRELMKQSGLTEDDEIEVTYKEVNRQNSRSVMDVDEDGNESKYITVTSKISKWLLRALEQIIEEFSEKENGNDLVFGPGKAGVIFEQIRVLASEHDLLSNVKIVKERSYIILCKRHQASSILQIVRQNKGKLGKYVFLTKGSLPHPNDLAACEAAAEKNMPHWSGKAAKK